MTIEDERRRHGSMQSLADASVPTSRATAATTARLKDAVSKAAVRRATTPVLGKERRLDDVDSSASRILLSWASPEVKALSQNRSDPAYRHLTSAADRGQELQLSLRDNPPQLFPEYDARRLIDFFLAWTQDMDRSRMGLDVINEHASDLGDVVPPWNFAWTESYILDPSVKPVSELPEPAFINGYQLTDQGRELEGCSCEDDICIPETCECFMRAIRKYPNTASWYARQLQEHRRHPNDPSKKLQFAYAAGGDGRLVDNIDLGTPIFECHHACSCDRERCTNRVVQHGRKVPLAFTKTQEKGWGIQALSDIPRGTFLGIYGGELLSDEASEYRADTYDNRLFMSYLQNLDSHVVKLFFTQRIVEEDLAQAEQLHLFRGSIENQEKLASCVTKANLLIEGYDEYLQYEQGVKDEVEDLKRSGRYTVSAEKRLWQALFAELRRGSDEAPFPYTRHDNQDILNYLSLNKPQQEQVQAWSKRQSDMEDAYSLVVDAGLFGNYTRFFNHSCQPNIVQFPVYADEPSILRPWLAFFTSRPVQKDEELCFNYYSGSTTEAVPTVQIKDLLTEPGTKTTSIIVSATSSAKTARSLGQSASGAITDCKCGAPNCIGEVFALTRQT